MATREQRARALGIPIEQLPDGRGKHGNHARGLQHPRWNPDGRRITDDGYIEVRVGYGHPLADANGWCYEHDLVAVAAIGRFLGPDEVVHHRNEVKTDNRWENLQVVTRAEHNRIHAAVRDRDPAASS
jgi:hypothetical protein